MTFDEILAQVIVLLQRQGRVSYGALKRRFTLDEAYLDDLKAELIDAQRLAVDEDSRVLVWTGAVGASPTLPPCRRLPRQMLARTSTLHSGTPPRRPLLLRRRSAANLR